MEKQPQLPQEDQSHGLAMDQFQEVNMRTYSNGANHLYGLDENGKNVHISHDSVLEAYGVEARPKAVQTASPEVPVTHAAPSKTRRRAFRDQGHATYEGIESTTPTEEAALDEPEEPAKTYRRATRPGTLEAREDASIDARARHEATLKDLQREFVKAADIDQDDVKAAEIAMKIDALTAAKAAENSDEIDFDNDPAGAEAALLAAGEAELARQDAIAIAEASSTSTAETGEPAEPAVEPVTDTTPKGLKARVGRIWRGAKAELGIFLSQTPVEYFKNQEKGDKRRIAAIGIAAGSVLAAGLVTIFAMKHGNHVGGSGGAANQLGGHGTGGTNGGNALPFGGAPKGGNTARHLTDSTLHIPRGKGFEDSIQQQYHLSDAQAHTVFQDVRPSIEHSPGTYHQGADLRISHSGNFSLNAQAQQALEDSVKKVRKAA